MQGVVQRAMCHKSLLATAPNTNELNKVLVMLVGQKGAGGKPAPCQQTPLEIQAK